MFQLEREQITLNRRKSWNILVIFPSRAVCGISLASSDIHVISSLPMSYLFLSEEEADFLNIM
ncbi:hypothetical protein TGAM01_v201794 [Trichoderma gamsii]|uniref:Uncharacterized protein n=1 Tax=Trichoderma gamsii TaxID=398673 RepID=A0A2P4ZZ21_9HYPO|nr:hypothetical protein TGAM01_v201794 [Trichoderma gamsii]PON29545.1 hypothetical protein TGAM01_v201794 [Trichoderma gamsii]